MGSHTEKARELMAGVLGCNPTEPEVIENMSTEAIAKALEEAHAAGRMAMSDYLFACQEAEDTQPTTPTDAGNPKQRFFGTLSDVHSLLSTLHGYDSGSLTETERDADTGAVFDAIADGGT